jgi:hypothetical protein
MTTDFWPFDQDRRCAVATLHSILSGGEPILHVFHDAEDHGWQFLDGNAPALSNLAFVALESIVKHDPSVLEVADMPPGWHAWRNSSTGAWQRAPSEAEVE